MAKHMEELDEDMASCATSCLIRTNRAKLSWRRTKTGMRRARRVESGDTRSSLPAIFKKRKHVMLS
eukprot:5106625-Amphidinium_carterae.1